MSDEESLTGGWQTDVRRLGSVVTRAAKPHSPTVMALLRHLQGRGFDGSPRPIGDGFTPDGREQLEYVDGHVHSTNRVDRAAMVCSGPTQRPHGDRPR